MEILLKVAAAVTSQTHTFSKKTQFIFVPLELQICSESKITGYKYFETLKESVQSGHLKTHPFLQKKSLQHPLGCRMHTHTAPKLHHAPAKKTLTRWETRSFQRTWGQWAMGKGDLRVLGTEYPAQQILGVWSWRGAKTPSWCAGDRRQN